MTARSQRLTAAGTAFLHGGAGGRAAGWPLVCLHGIGGDATSFAAQIDGLAGPGRRVLSWDMPGYGSSAPLSKMNFGTLCDRLCAALGALGLPEGAGAVRTLFEELAGPEAPQDLRMAAATSLVGLGEGDVAAAWLNERLAGRTDPSEAEVALGRWLRAGAAGTRIGFPEALAAWNEHADPPGALPNTERAIARRQARARTLEPLLPGLLGG